MATMAAQFKRHCKIEVFNTFSRGRGIKSKVPFTAGSEVLECHPYVFVSRSEMHGKICDTCLTIKEWLQRCSSCKLVYYCGLTCQRMAWKLHKLECKHLNKMFPKMPSDTVRLLGLLLLRNDDSDEDWLHELTTHSDEIRKEKSEMFTHILAVLNTYLDTRELNNANVFEQFCKVNCNTFTISDGETKPIGKLKIQKCAVCVYQKKTREKVK